MTALPDCVETRSETRALEIVSIDMKNGIPHSVCGTRWKGRVGGIPWRFFVKDSKVRKGFNMTVCCSGVHKKDWKIAFTKVTFEFKEAFSDQNANIVSRSFENLEFNEQYRQLDVVLTEQELHFLLGGHAGRTKILRVFMSVEGTNHFGISRAPVIKYDFRRQSVLSSLVVSTEEDRFFVNLGYLAQLSTHFADLLLHPEKLPKDEETGLLLLRLDDVTASEFETLLELLHPMNSNRTLNLEDIEKMLKLADRFKLTTIQILCAKEMRCVSGSLLKKLSICEKYDMEWIMEKLLYDHRYDIQVIANSTEIHTLSKKTLQMMATRLSMHYDGSSGSSDDDIDPHS